MFGTTKTKNGAHARPVQRVASLLTASLMAITITLGTEISAQAADFGNWQVKRLTDPMDDSSVALLIVQSTDERVTLGINCAKDAGAVGILWGQFLGGEELNGEELKDVTYRVDQGKSATVLWKVMPDRTTVRSRDPQSLVTELSDSSRLVVQVAPYQETPVTVTFETKGLKEALLATGPECDWLARNLLIKQRLEKDRQAELVTPPKPIDPALYKKWSADAAAK